MEEKKSNKKALIITICVVAAVIITLIILGICGVFSGNGKEENANGNQQQASQTATQTQSQSKADNGSVSSDNQIRYTFSSSNKWEGNGKVYNQYNLNVINDSNDKVTAWKVEINDFDGYQVDQAWNCKYSIDNGSLIIEPVDYNAVIEAGKQIDNVGLIIMGPDKALSSGSVAATTTKGEVTEKQSDSAGSQDAITLPEIPVISGGGYKAEDGTPVANHGRLSVSGTKLVDSKGEAIQLRGVSTHGIQWFPQYVTEDTFKTFRDEWKINVIRLAMYAGENGYVTGNTAAIKKTLMEGVEYASKLGLYVIIDWHTLNDDRDPNTYKSQAIEFWDEMSNRYKDYENVIYEICNEPNSGTSWSSVKSYGDDVVETIRKNDKNAVILCGTPQWCQLPQDVIGNELNDDNTMYTVHFYAATHKDDIRNNLKTALSAGVPIFVSECSICDASGNGANDYSSAQDWVDLLDSNGISFVVWNISNKSESSALIGSGSNALSGWSDSELSDSGRWFKSIFTR